MEGFDLVTIKGCGIDACRRVLEDHCNSIVEPLLEASKKETDGAMTQKNLLVTNNSVKWIYLLLSHSDSENDLRTNRPRT